jgi:hypothetical protein
VFRSGRPLNSPVHVVRLASDTAVEDRLLRFAGWGNTSASEGPSAMNSSLFSSLGTEIPLSRLTEPSSDDELPRSEEDSDDAESRVQDPALAETLSQWHHLVNRVFSVDPFRDRNVESS